jgi:glycine cleavage system regulatory protein
MAVSQYLGITFISSYRPSFLQELTEIVAAHRCEVIQFYTREFQGELTGSLIISASWGVLSKCETAMQKFFKKAETLFNLKRIEELNAVLAKNRVIPYVFHLSGVDSPEFISNAIRFFTGGELVIVKILTSIYETKPGNVQMRSLSLHVHLPIVTHFGEFREAFFSFCDEFGFDGFYEPEK